MAEAASFIGGSWPPPSPFEAVRGAVIPGASGPDARGSSTPRSAFASRPAQNPGEIPSRPPRRTPPNDIESRAPTRARKRAWRRAYNRRYMRLWRERNAERYHEHNRDYQRKLALRRKELSEAGAQASAEPARCGYGCRRRAVTTIERIDPGTWETVSIPYCGFC